MNSPSDFEPYKIQDSGSYVKIRYRVRIVGGPSLKGASELETMDFVTGYASCNPWFGKETCWRNERSEVDFRCACGRRVWCA